ncbi:glycosyltransferase [Kistimonas asteriae]|uniref:glycosyltransferase n=1 Tax=Kistimonas asteriae TaxID=517724 RepID=UPI001BA60975|nr:glycosyltransferase [Kistimonas asteriae]
MTSKLRILQIQNNFNVNESDLAEQIIKGLDGDRFDITTAFLKKKPREGDQLSAAHRSVYFDFSSKQLKGMQRYLALYRLYRFCKDNAFDVVICHRFKPTHLFLLLNRFLSFRLCVSVTHGLGDFDRRYRQKAVNRLIQKNWRFVGVSEAVKNDLVKHCNSLNDQNTLVINNAIDIKRAHAVQHTREKAREMLSIDHQRFVFGTIGRLVPVKGHKYLIDAARLLKDKYPDMQVVIIGGGRLDQTLQKQIDEHQLNDVVKLVGWKDNALQYVRAFDVFALPSLSEGMPISLLEAMSGALPTIGSDIPSIRPVIEKVGQLAMPEDAEALAQAMEKYLQMTPEAITHSGKEHLAYLQANHAIEDYRRQYRQLIEQV